MRRLSNVNNSNHLTLWKEPLILVPLSLIMLNLFNVAIYFCYLLIPILAFIFIRNIFLIDYNFIFICIFSVLYTVFISINGIPVGSMTTLLGYAIFPPVFYFLGKFLVNKYTSTLSIYFLLFFMIFLFSILPFFANVRSLIENGFMTQRNVRMFWMNTDQVKSATGMGAYFAINMALLPLLFSYKALNMERKLVLFSIFLFAIGVFSTLNMSNRAGLFITSVSLLVFVFIPHKKTSFKSFLFMLIFFIILIVLFFIDLWSLRSWFENSFYFTRLLQTDIYEEGSRYLTWGKSLKMLFDYPLGGFNYSVNYTLGFTYAHNLWLDVGLKTGIIPLIPLLYFTISAIGSVVKVVFNQNFEIFLRILIAGVGIAFYITFLLEPVLEGLFIMFFLYCFYFGIIAEISVSKFN